MVSTSGSREIHLRALHRARFLSRVRLRALANAGVSENGDGRCLPHDTAGRSLAAGNEINWKRRRESGTGEWRGEPAE